MELGTLDWKMIKNIPIAISINISYINVLYLGSFVVLISLFKTCNKMHVYFSSKYLEQCWAPCTYVVCGSLISLDPTTLLENYITLIKLIMIYFTNICVNCYFNS